MIRIGTSGWNYQDWDGLFYPHDIRQKDWLSYYAQSFNTVEINTTFYHLPSEESVAHWYEQVPDKFQFSVKASRYITHLKHLRDPESSLVLFLEKAGQIKEKLGPILFQLPPRWHPDPERLNQFVALLPGNLRYVFEFRNAEWYCEKVLTILNEAGCALCIHDHKDGASDRDNSADFAYIRLHGSSFSKDGCYEKAEITQWADRLKQLEKKHGDVYCYFNNDWQGYAVQNAQQLISKLNERE